MKRTCSIIFVLWMCVPWLFGGQLQTQLNHRWKGAWVVITAECTSDCNGGYSNNAVLDGRTTGRGRFLLEKGELAKVLKVDVKRSRVDVFLDVETHMLVPFQDGPFELYEDAKCNVELEIAIPRAVIKSKDVEAVENLFSSIIKRFSDKTQATNSDIWNRRERAPFPEDYQDTLAAHARWKAEQTNLAIQVRIDEAMEEASSILKGMRDEDDYALGFAKGASMRRHLGNCDSLLNSTVHTDRKSPPRGAASKDFKEGFRDGQDMAYYVELAKRLSRCYVPIP